MITLDNIGIDFGGNWLLRHANVQINPGERIGLIGRNGAGKSTLLRMLNNELQPSEGRFHKAGKLEIAFFNQDLLSYRTDRSIDAVARDAFAPVLKLGAEIEALLQRMEGGDTDVQLLDDLAAKQALFEAQGGPTIDANVYTVLHGLGFKPEEHNAPYQTFSGGWRMRVLLAKILLMEPDVLLLDEPTNHLDLPSIQWLENYLKTFKGTVITVSHDRSFIDRIAERIFEISLRRLTDYSGNYSYYQKEKALRSEQHAQAYENQQKFIKEQEQFINRFRYKATKANQVQSRIKQLDKLERLLPPEEERARMNMRFTIQTRSGKEVLNLTQIHKAYGPKVILEDSRGTIMRGDKIALIGANGLGKSTLLRIIAERESFDGAHKIGHNVVPTFFAQHQLEALNLQYNILEEISAAASDRTEQELRTVLGCFMFTGDEVEKKVKVLSGGEKSRVALAKTLLSEANFLLLDEPTNHLDIQSIQILVEALQAYEGTYVVVSHDRFFLQEVANKIWYIEDRQIKEYLGTYAEFEEWKARIADEALEASVPNSGQVEVQQESTLHSGELSFAERKQLRNRKRKLEREQAEVEARIEALEGELAALEAQMADPAVAADFTRLTEIQTQHQDKHAVLETATEKWEEVLMALEALAG
ncbi:MAG: ABC-F family ATP-binding cassette domain-containing protein [Bacteroidota bacterium]